MLDEFIWGRVSRISPEATSSSSRGYFGSRTTPEGAANVARNVRECGTQAYVMGLIGDDIAGTKLRKILEETGIRQETVRSLRHSKQLSKHESLPANNRLSAG